MPRSNYSSDEEYRASKGDTMKKDLESAYDKYQNKGQGGPKKPKPEKMKATGKKTAVGAAV